MDIKIILPAVSDEPLADMLRAITEAIVKRDNDRWVGGFLGGEFGYGAEWQSDVFDMRPFYWGDCDCGYEERSSLFWDDPANKHTFECYHSELDREKIKAGARFDPRWGFVTWPDDLPYDQRRAIEDSIYERLCAKHGLSRGGCAVHCNCGVQERASAYFAEHGHRPNCALALPNFRHHASGLEVRWYKYIGRDMECSGDVPADLTPIFQDCLSAIAAQAMSAGTAETAQQAQGQSPASAVREDAPNEVQPLPDTSQDNTRGGGHDQFCVCELCIAGRQKYLSECD